MSHPGCHVSEEKKQAIVLSRSQFKLEPADPTKQYSLVCPNCDKPNSLHVKFCTGCSLTLAPEDRREVPANIFLDIVKGNVGTTVIRLRTPEICVFDDKFPVSENHIDVIPTCLAADSPQFGADGKAPNEPLKFDEIIVDITSLTSQHLPLLERLYKAGKDEFMRRIREGQVPWWHSSVFLSSRECVRAHRYCLLHQKNTDSDDFDEIVIAGFNFPVSIPHLHLHMALPPFRHEKVFGFPRWHSYKSIHQQLSEYGRCLPNAARLPESATTDAQIPKLTEEEIRSGYGENLRAVKFSQIAQSRI